MTFPWRSRRVPLAWSNLVHSKAKLLGSLAGITFAVALMFMEMGFQNALLDGMVRLLRGLDADLVILSRSSYSLGFKHPFSSRHLYEAGRFEGVVRVSPVYIETALSRWRNPLTGARRAIRVVAFRPDDRVFLDPGISRQAEALEAPDSALFDTRGKWWIYGGEDLPFWESLWSYGGPRAGTRVELAGRPVRIVGNFDLGSDFLNDGTLLMSDRNYLNYFADRRLDGSQPPQVDLGLIKVDAATREDPAKLKALKERIANTLPAAVVLRAREEVLEGEQAFWLTSTPVGFIFQLGMVMGFIVGTVICYQILHSDISSYLKEYATLIAIGYTRADLVRVVLEEALYLSVVGFFCGAGLAFLLYGVLEWTTRMPYVLDRWRLLSIFVATLLMCLVSACFAARKLWHAAPADLF